MKLTASLTSTLMLDNNPTGGREMSKRIDCPKCGEPMDVPAYEGDGVFTVHTCQEEK
jgi:hypothetical protein